MTIKLLQSLRFRVLETSTSYIKIFNMKTNGTLIEFTLYSGSMASLKFHKSHFFEF